MPLNPRQQACRSTQPMIVTSCTGVPFWAAAPAWLQHLRQHTEAPVEIVSPDLRQINGATVVTAQRVHSLSAPESLWLGRLERAVHHIRRDASVIQIDLDVALQRDPEPLVELPYDFIISRAHGAPKRAVQHLGFVGCCGFYIAKPRALPFCEAWAEATRSRSLGSGIDQVVLNYMLCEAAEACSPVQETRLTVAARLALDVFHSHGCLIGVLPDDAVARGCGPAIYANHHPGVMEMWRQQADAATQDVALAP